MRDDGGPAFPTHRDEDIDGMSLRDWLAGQAISGFAMNEADRDGPRNIAYYAYQIADAMLKERSK